MNRKIYFWKLRTTELQLGERTLIMGVLNVTPDSFSDGGRYSDPDQAYARAMEMEEQGVDIIDIGAESTRPESKRISADEEWQRLVPVLKKLRGNVRVPISLDTYKSETAERALEYGVEILNDPSGLTFDADLAKIAVAGNAGLILNHMRGLPETWAKQPPMRDVMGGIGEDLEATVSRARRMGVEKNRIMIDPGIGFGKRKEQNSEILAHLARLASLDYPILVGPSRKSFLMQAAEGETVHATAAAVTAAILNGAHIVRVHDVKEMRIVAQVADEILRAGAPAVKAEAAERAAKAPRREGPPAFLGEERAKPTRPPLAKPKAPPALPYAPAAKQSIEDRPIVRRPPQDKPSKGWTPDRNSPDRNSPDRGYQDRGSRDRGERSGPPRRDFSDRAPRTGPPQDRPRRDRPTGDRPGGDRPTGDRPGGDRPFGDRPQRGGYGDRPQRGAPQGRPPYRSAEGRPPRRDSGDGPPRGPAGRPFRGPSSDGPRSDRPRSDRPRSDRPPSRGPAGGRPQGRPPQGGRPEGGPPRRPFRKRP